MSDPEQPSTPGPPDGVPPPVTDEPTAPRALRASEVSPTPRALEEILERLPAEPGVYVMKDRRGKILYIGKAASLRTRVRQYFQPNTGDIRDFVPLLAGIVHDIETTVTSNEKEALLLENTLIKKHQPRFNVKLRDDKNYLVLRLDPEAEWPKLEVVRRMKEDQAYYFGPYHSATATREALRVVNRHFQLRTCTDHVLHNRRRPCLQYQIKRCPAPCVLPVSRDEYGEQVRDVRLFLDGKSDELLDRLRARMKDASAKTEYERAATVRDQIRALESSLESQRVVSADFCDQDVIGFHREGIALEIVVIAIRGGKMAGTRAFSFTDQEFPDAEILSSFLGLYYDLSQAVPDEVLLPFPIADAEVKAEWLADLRGTMLGQGARRRKVEVLVPQRGARRDLAELARKNAAASFVSRRNAHADAEATLAKLQKRLKLHRLPRVIECYDISHVQGSDTVASMVVFIDGKPEKTRYRTYKLHRGVSAGSPDDFASMYEVLSRRLRRARELARESEEALARGQVDPGEASGWKLPDLIVVDGGKGQLGMALAAARDVGIDLRPGTGLPIIALAKERETEAVAQAEAESAQEGGKDEKAEVEVPEAETTEAQKTEAETTEAQKTEAQKPRKGPRKTKPGVEDGKRPDRVFLPNAKDPIPIRPNSAEMFVLAHLRDEAHRFAVAFHRGQRRRRTLRSALSDIAGIGTSRQRELLRHFGSVRKIRDASLEDLLQVPGMGKKAAEAVRAYFDAHGELAPPVSAGSEAPAEAEEDAVESAFAEEEAGEELAAALDPVPDPASDPDPE
jgi:excinuclease ABC subunit C